MKRVLVFPCGSEIGLEINRSLAHSTHFEMYGASSIDNHGAYVYRNYIGGVPNIDDEDCIEKINAIIDEYGIDFIFPAHDSAVLKFARHADELHAVVVTSPEATCEICRSKLRTYEVLDGVVPTPVVYNEVDSSALEFPLFCKPDVGQGSRGAHRIASRKDYDYYVAGVEGLVLSEFLPGPEYTIDCFTDRNGNLRFCEGRRRARISNGICVNAVPVKNPEFRRLAELINSKMTFRGMWFFQLKERADGELVLMEIAPRIAGTMGLYRGIGVNFALLSLFDAMEYDVDVFCNNYTIENDRALCTRFKTDVVYDTVYMDFDDTVTTRGQINTDVMKFIYQARNEGKRIVLVSRHERDLKQTLADYSIAESLFADIIVIRDKTIRKSDLITEKRAVFIDDSYAERKDVYERCGIPVFAPDSIDVLLNHRI